MEYRKSDRARLDDRARRIHPGPRDVVARLPDRSDDVVGPVSSRRAASNHVGIFSFDQIGADRGYTTAGLIAPVKWTVLSNGTVVRLTAILMASPAAAATAGEAKARSKTPNTTARRTARSLTIGRLEARSARRIKRWPSGVPPIL